MSFNCLQCNNKISFVRRLLKMNYCREECLIEHMVSQVDLRTKVLSSGIQAGSSTAERKCKTCEAFLRKNRKVYCNTVCKQSDKSGAWNIHSRGKPIARYKKPPVPIADIVKEEAPNKKAEKQADVKKPKSPVIESVVKTEIPFVTQMGGKDVLDYDKTINEFTSVKSTVHFTPTDNSRRTRLKELSRW